MVEISNPNLYFGRSLLLKHVIIFTVVVFELFSLCAWTQETTAPASDSDFVTAWWQRSSRAAAEQPFWMAPLFTVTPRLVQQFRYDMAWQSQGNATTANYGTGKGLELIPTEHTEILISAPPYVTRTAPGLHDGFGDMTFLFKYRLAAGTEEHGNYVVTALLNTTVPTGSYSNGSTHGAFSPTLGLGKGWGDFDIQSTASVTLPTGNVDILGTPVGLNATFQYRLFKKFWPEVEVNSTFWTNGKNAGKKQVFLSPGLVVGRLHLWRRVGFAIGAGVQIAATSFHTYNHSRVISVRFPF